LRSSTTFASVLALFVALLVAGPVSGARVDKVHVEIKTLANGKSKYTGEIKSAVPECVSGRTVRVSSKNSRLVKTKTDNKGKFSAVGKSPEKGDKLTVKVPPKGECPKLIGESTAR
jgi:outer membrane murein-binding lipoprotein Lpp